MLETYTELSEKTEFARLMRLGQTAHAQGKKKTAYHYWQQAVALDPGNEQAWTALMWVIDNDEDRRVCLNNILEINPENHHAKRLLKQINRQNVQYNNVSTSADVQTVMKQEIDMVRITILSAIFGTGIAIIILLLFLILR